MHDDLCDAPCKAPEGLRRPAQRRLSLLTNGGGVVREALLDPRTLQQTPLLLQIIAHLITARLQDVTWPSILTQFPRFGLQPPRVVGGWLPLGSTAGGSPVALCLPLEPLRSFLLLPFLD